ncbi:heterokaryon incompatibility protein-domain-containing protein [Diaporthe sp. PMI_573]|nr:heterokaryon incompatibility protein-domain-containing protein [Diaporthaceae sp. PMI_573]
MWKVLIARSCDEPQTPGFGRAIDPEWVDLGLARRWKRDCLTQHKDKCRNPFTINAVSPAWVIDTALKCIVPGVNISEYVALSYRWSGSAGFRTTRHLLKDLQKPGALSQGSRLGNSMAPILRHAIELTQAIDERYLWVDAVCIVQDDETHLLTQLGLMGAIYATAKLTIVSCDGDAVDGILGLKGISPPRRVDQRLTPVFEREKVIFHRRPDFETGASPYFDRGWTFQEFFLSQRRLIFAGGQIHWHCSCAYWMEELIPSENTYTDRWAVDAHLSYLLKGVPYLGSLNVILSQYNARNLSFPEDALPGISGLLSLLSRTSEGGFLFGLPETAFDSALMWHSSLGRFAEMTKREDSGRTDRPALASRLPSWSWVSWRTPNLCVSDEETFKVRDRRDSWTIPITQWFTQETPEAIEVRPIQSHWFRFRDKFINTNCDLPQGWTREKPEEILGADWREYGYYKPPPHGLGKYIYQHAAALDDEYFWLPVPIATGSQETDSPGPLQTPYISCNTKHGWFSAALFPKTYFSDSQLSRCPEYLTAVGLLNARGEYCGRLYLQGPDDILRFPEASSGRAFEVELVAICFRREITTDFNSWRPYSEDEEEILDNVFKDVYGVLWVEWIDRIIYRRASGVVGKDKWEKHNLEDVHLVMG